MLHLHSVSCINYYNSLMQGRSFDEKLDFGFVSQTVSLQMNHAVFMQLMRHNSACHEQ